MPRSVSVVVCSVLFFAVGCNEPRHQNRTLSSWIHDLGADEDFKRRKACEAVGALGPQAEKAIPKVIALLDDPNEGVQDFASDALSKIGPAAVPALEEVLKRPEPVVRMHGAAALIAIEPSHQQAGSILAKAVTGVGNAELAERAQEIMVKQGAPMVAHLRPFFKDTYAPVRLQVVRTLRKMGPAAVAVLPELKAAVADQELDIRLEALNALAVVGKREDVEATFEGLLEDENEEVATTAASLLKYIGARGSASGYEKTAEN